MVGGGSRRDEGSLMINNTNVFAALDALKKKKKSDKERKSKGSSTSQVQSKEPEPQVFWAPTPLNAKSWADVDDDDDYFATTAPPQSVWGVSEPEQSKEKPSYVEDSESEEDILDEGDDDVEEEHDHEPELSVNPEHDVKKPAEISVAPKEAERQLSKKERKKKELAELEALLADFGVAQKESNDQDEPRGALQDKKDAEADGEMRENVTAESKTAKKKKKKDKASKEVKESQDQPNVADTNNVGDEVTASENAEDDTSTVHVKERLKKVASIKKKKSSKEMDAAARAAAQEAAARSARLAAAKKKEKNHYNQQPMR
ncbi:uncharacterized protein LOC129294163 [Prosopis cineraria]|uniref:uncharacterized protein LOC129294163 n=1 Tax=Prosopis cineraria TaxID=364024 RepID=UPI00240FE123|nr:uncharacterized protein LOC129294163 [Prosopis cineraria]XP_054788315.1 uncharacterized protein LOC129294163 [Prosopis cineraria]XP_054788316.1 uncharacterized protein LOC129294163 [Prosopis cineraria]XP_054788317.1 uncharacterized protein LOC129294163 [Prosopis cineraria]XP_054788318.1 uncharacterized protein LOC129294163 [Prosopis cineraria]